MGEGRSEALIKGVIAGQRDRVFVVSKVEADQVTGKARERRRALTDTAGASSTWMKRIRHLAASTANEGPSRNYICGIARRAL
jgi:hypothetical protein